MKRWNPKDKLDRPSCERIPGGGRCIQNCRNLIVEPDGRHGCLEVDFKEKMMKLADHVISASTPTEAPSDDMIPIEKQDGSKPPLMPGRSATSATKPRGRPKK